MLPFIIVFAEVRSICHHLLSVCVEANYNSFRIKLFFCPAYLQLDFIVWNKILKIPCIKSTVKFVWNKCETLFSNGFLSYFPETTIRGIG